MKKTKDPFDKEDLSPDAEEYEDKRYKPKSIKKVKPKPYTKTKYSFSPFWAWTDISHLD